MNLLKRITAVMAALLIAVNLSVINTFAAMAAPVAAEEIAEVLIALLLGAGHSQSELSGMSVTQMQSLVTDDLNSGRINQGTILTDPITQSRMTALEFFTRPDVQAVNAVIQTMSSQAINDFVGSIVSSVDGEVKLNEDYFTAISTTDIIDGYGACLVMPATGGGGIRYYYCQYAVIDPEDNSIYVKGPMQYKTEWDSGKTTWSRVYNDSITWDSYLKSEIYSYYGDIRYKDGTEAPTDDEYETELGETADGTKVTADMLNPDGTVTIDGVTYYPADYLDKDKLTDKGKDALLAALLAALANTYVKSDDKPIVDDKDITIDISEELEDFTVSPSIITVFPFCLPFDFVRGMKLFSAKPVTPHFEITIDVPAILNVPAQKWTLEIDLGKFETLAKITRWTSLVGFSYLLISLSTKIVKGAGA